MPFDNPRKFRVCAVLGEYSPDGSSVIGSDTVGGWGNITVGPHRPGVNSYETIIGYGQISTYGLRGYALARLQSFDASHSTFDRDVYSGGVTGIYDGWKPVECGFVGQPWVYVYDFKYGSMANGLYAYVAVWSFRDKEGRVTYSRTSEPASVVTAGGNGNINIDVTVPTAHSATDTQCTVHLYRTAVGGTIYYLVESRLVTSTVTTPQGTVFESFTDSLADATLITRPQLYRAPGTSGTALDRCNPLSSRHIVRHKDRVFYAHESTVFYSSFEVDGEQPWFSPGFSFEVPGGTGPITGLASMDGVLVIFKRDGVWAVDGEGPPENGGTGTEFSEPRRFNIKFGCVDPRSVVQIPEGIAYKSERGIELLTRGYKNVWIGEKVQATVNAYPFCGGGTYDVENSRLLYCLGDTLAVDGGLSYTTSGVTICYDTVNLDGKGIGLWTKWIFTNSNAYGDPMQDVVYAPAPPADQNSPAWRTSGVFVVDHNNTFFYLHPSLGTDRSGTFVPWKITTGWVRGASKQDRIRVTDLLFLGRRLSNHNLRCDYFINYNRASTGTIRIFDATSTNVTPEQFEFQPGIESVQSMKFELSSETPTNPAVIGDGTQCEINAITVRVGAKGGQQKLPSTQKG